jgi:Ca2+-binding EF-hand superfamily protein
MRLFGKNVSVKTIGNTLINECNWSRNGTGVTLSNVIQLLNALHEELGLDEHVSHFSDFDANRKGWINTNDFVSVSFSQ